MTVSHPIDHDHDHYAAVSTDLSVYGPYAPHFRYRQECIAHATAIIAMTSPATGEGSTGLSTIRERIGMALIAWGIRLRDGHAPVASSPAPAR
ncbi:MAG: hypothetical protein QM589_15285 [Thermomicrobiales bacterium]